MTEERLKDIQDNINERNMFPNRMYIFREDINNEEQELVNEIKILNNRINNALHLIKHSDITDYRVFDKELINILRGDNK